MDEIKFGTIIPLIGGSAIGCASSANTKPSFHLSYNAFTENESHLEEYWQDVPLYRLDSKNSIPDNTFENVDYVNSVCPCAGLSLLNSTSSRGSDAAQNEWMYNSSKYILNHVKPKVLWGENAPGLFTKMGEDVVNNLREIATTYDYSFSLFRTNTELHGIPQRRIRTFYFFWDSPTVPKLKWKYRSTKKLLEYLQEIPDNASLQDTFRVKGKVTEHFRPYEFILKRENISHAEFYEKNKKTSISKYLQENRLFEECINWLKEYYPNEGFSNKKNTKTFVDLLKHQKEKVINGKGYWDSSPYFSGDSFSALIGRSIFNSVHPIENRYLNVREMLHLMGMPHDFEIKINKPKDINHIAQNVPVKTAEDMANEVKDFCLGNARMTNYSFMKQDNIKKEIVYSETFRENPKKYKVNKII